MNNFDWVLWITTKLDELEMGRCIVQDVRKELYDLKKQIAKEALKKGEENVATH
jgi:hypothetical protein